MPCRRRSRPSSRWCSAPGAAWSSRFPLHRRRLRLRLEALGLARRGRGVVGRALDALGLGLELERLGERVAAATAGDGLPVVVDEHRGALLEDRLVALGLPTRERVVRHLGVLGQGGRTQLADEGGDGLGDRPRCPPSRPRPRASAGPSRAPRSASRGRRACCRRCRRRCRAAARRRSGPRGPRRRDRWARRASTQRWLGRGLGRGAVRLRWSGLARGGALGARRRDGRRGEGVGAGLRNSLEADLVGGGAAPAHDQQRDSRGDDRHDGGDGDDCLT